MEIRIFDSPEEMATAAAGHAAGIIRLAVDRRRSARVVAATGASQIPFLDALIREGGIQWSKITFFHLDEYLGVDDSHPASFRRYLRERLADRVRPAAFHYVDGSHPDPLAECRRLGALITAAPIDVAFAGIGENGHLAFNDPPADFETDEPFIVVRLDEACRRQQVAEGWFRSVGDVPATAISMSIRQIVRSRHIVCVVPGARKARAVRECLTGEVMPLHPASILRTHSQATVFLDRDSARHINCP